MCIECVQNVIQGGLGTREQQMSLALPADTLKKVSVRKVGYEKTLLLERLWLAQIANVVGLKVEPDDKV